MKNFLIQVTVQDPYPKMRQYRVEATHFATGCARALKLFRKDMPRRKIKGFTVQVTDLGDLTSRVSAVVSGKADLNPDDANKKVLDAFFQKVMA